MSFEDKFYSQHKSLSFNDVLIQPTSTSSVESRLSTDLTTSITADLSIGAPILASPMDRVVNLQVANVLAEKGCVVCFHRFQTVEEQVNQVSTFHAWQRAGLIENPSLPIITAVSAQDSEEELERVDRLSEYSDAFVIDTAMGTNTRVLKAIYKIKKKYPKIGIIAGNIVNPEGAQTLIDHGADAIRAGIGNGSACVTRLQTGCGRGQLTVLIECKDICEKNNVKLISDGGVTTPGDFAKAMAAGADVVMMGSPLAGHDESPGEIYYKYDNHFFLGDQQIYIPSLGLRPAKEIDGLRQYKQYRGMASKELQESWKGGLKPGTTFEGIQNFLKLKGPLRETLTDFLGGLRSSMSYCDATTISEFHENAKFEKLSAGSQRESYDRPNYY